MKAKLKAVWKTVHEPVLLVLAGITLVFIYYVYGAVLHGLFPTLGPEDY